MPPLTESAANRLSTEQAAALMHVLDLQARWDALLGDKGQKESSTGLRELQRTHAAFQEAWAKYAAMNPNALLPEPTHARPDRVGVWCRVLHILFQQAGGSFPAALMSRVFRLVDRIAANLEIEPAKRPAEEMDSSAVLEAVSAWCEALVPLSPLFPKKKVAA